MLVAAMLVAGFIVGWWYKRHDEEVWRRRYLQAQIAYYQQTGRHLDGDWMIGFTGPLQRREWFTRPGEVTEIP